MSEEQKKVIQLALGVNSGRLTLLDDDDYRVLGFDPNKIRRYGGPTINEVKAVCEEVLTDLLVTLWEDMYEATV
jgi:hypothetical protein